MEKEIFQVVLEIINRGGMYGVLGLVLWLVLGLIKVCLVLSFIKIIALTLMKSVTDSYQLRLETKAKNIVLLSEKVSEQLMSALKNLKEDLKQSKKESKKS